MTLRRLLVPAVLLAALSAGCASGQPAGTSPTNPPTPTPARQLPAEAMTAEAASHAADRVFAMNAAGDYAGVWESYTRDLRQLVSRPDYVRFSQACSGPDGSGVLAKVSSIRPDGADYVVTVEALNIAAAARTMHYEDGAWRLVPTAEAVRGWKAGPDVYLAAQKSAGRCSAASS